MTNLEQNFLESATRYFRESQSKEIDWEQRRYEIAKDTVQALVQRASVNPCFSKNIIHNVDFAVKYADALIEKLKKK